MDNVFQIFFDSNKYFQLHPTSKPKQNDKAKESIKIIIKKDDSHQKEEAKHKLVKEGNAIPTVKSISFPITHSEANKNIKSNLPKTEAESDEKNNKNKLISDVISSLVSKAVESSIEEECNISVENDTHNSIKGDNH
jgi:hypothetical protein